MKMFASGCIAWVCVALLSSAGAEEKRYDLREGDIVFSSSRRGQGEAIINATDSPYTHCGMVVSHEGKLVVIEAVEPVGLLDVNAFVSRSAPGTFLAKRMKSPVPGDAYQKARAWAMRQIGKNYDPRFGWTDDRMYCSELVWKIYDKAGIRLCEPRRFGDYNLDRPSVKKLVAERYGNIGELPKDEEVAAPADLERSALLVEVPRLP